jgi:hypothetical protein
MIRAGFLSDEDRAKLIALARDGSTAARVTRRANVLVLLDDGWSCREVAAALLLDDDTVRNLRKLFEQRGIEGLTSFGMGGSAGFFGPCPCALTTPMTMMTLEAGSIRQTRFKSGERLKSPENINITMDSAWHRRL